MTNKIITKIGKHRHRRLFSRDVSCELVTMKTQTLARQSEGMDESPTAASHAACQMRGRKGGI